MCTGPSDVIEVYLETLGEWLSEQGLEQKVGICWIMVQVRVAIANSSDCGTGGRSVPFSTPRLFTKGGAASLGALTPNCLGRSYLIPGFASTRIRTRTDRMNTLLFDLATCCPNTESIWNVFVSAFHSLAA